MPRTKRTPDATGPEVVKDRAFQDQLERAIDDLERATSAEVVMLLAATSDSYRDVDLLAGALLAIASLTFMVFSPLPVHEVLAVTNTTLAFVVGAYASSRWPAARRLLSSRKRRHEQVRRAALAAFQEEGVGATRDRNGMLIYVSLLEGRVEIVPDSGIQGRIPPARWNEIFAHVRGIHDRRALAGALVKALEACQGDLATAFPPGADNPDEIPNRPRIRS